MYHYTYLLTNKDDGRHYIGVRTSKLPPKQDPYMSSCTTVTKEYLQNCRKSIIQMFDTRLEAAINEILWHNLLDVGANPLYFNGAKQTSTGFDLTGIPKSEAHKSIISKTHKGKIVSKETKAKQLATVAARRKAGLYNKPRQPISEQSKLKMSLSQKRWVTSPDYKNPFKDKHHTLETKSLISYKNKKAWENDKTKARTFSPWFIHDLIANTYTTFTNITKTDYAISKGFHSRAILEAAYRSKGTKQIKCVISTKCIIGNLPTNLPLKDTSHV